MLVANVASIYLRLRVLLVVALLALVAGENAFAQDPEPAEQAAEAVDSEASEQETGLSESSGQDAAATSDTNTDNLPPIEITQPAAKEPAESETAVESEPHVAAVQPVRYPARSYDG